MGPQPCNSKAVLFVPGTGLPTDRSGPYNKNDPRPLTLRPILQSAQPRFDPGARAPPGQPSNPILDAYMMESAVPSTGISTAIVVEPDGDKAMEVSF